MTRYMDISIDRMRKRVELSLEPLIPTYGGGWSVLEYPKHGLVWLGMAWYG